MKTAAYAAFLAKEFCLPAQKSGPVVLDLFAGCGGLALGFEAAGFITIGFEKDADCCATYRHNLKTPCHQLLLKPGQELTDGAQVIIGGPPCQPLSVNGHQQGRRDERDQWFVVTHDGGRDLPERRTPHCRLPLSGGLRSAISQDKKPCRGTHGSDSMYDSMDP